MMEWGSAMMQLFWGAIYTPVRKHNKMKKKKKKRKHNKLTHFTKLNSNEIVLWSVMYACLGEKMFVSSKLPGKS